MAKSKNPMTDKEAPAYKKSLVGVVNGKLSAVSVNPNTFHSLNRKTMDLNSIGSIEKKQNYLNACFANKKENYIAKCNRCNDSQFHTVAVETPSGTYAYGVPCKCIESRYSATMGLSEFESAFGAVEKYLKG